MERKSDRIVLKIPIPAKTDEGKDIEIQTLKLQRVKMKHLKAFPDSFFAKEGEKLDVSEMIPIIAAVTGETKEVIEEIDIIDMMDVIEKVSEYVIKQLGGSEGNGEN